MIGDNNILLYRLYENKQRCDNIYEGEVHMGRTSSAVKDRYNAKAYDEIKVRVPKGKKQTIKAHADLQGESVNGFIGRAIDETMQRDNTSTSDAIEEGK